LVFKEFLFVVVNSTEAQIIFRIILAVCFGALIGLEREHAQRPAGLRTHILVCVGSCLVMLTSEFVYNYYHQFSPNMDVARLGAQVISGVGFLGAGTIIRNGSSVKGLTTAASVWAVACVGLATGIGFYFGATIATLIIYISLIYSKKFSKIHDTQKFSLEIISTHENINSLIGSVEKIFSENTININKLNISTQEDKSSSLVFQLSTNNGLSPTSILSTIYSLPGVNSININSKQIIKEEV